MGLAMLPHSSPDTEPKSTFSARRANSPTNTTGTKVSTKPMAIHSAPSGRMTVSKKCAPASSPRQARYIESPKARSIRLALCVV